MFKEVMNLNKLLHKTNQWFWDKVLNFAIPTGRILPKPWSLHPPAVPISVRRHQDWWLLHSAPPNTSVPAPVSTWLTGAQYACCKRAQSSNVHIWYTRLQCAQSRIGTVCRRSNAVLLNPTLGTVCLPPTTNSILRPTDKYNPHMHKHGIGDCASIVIS